MAEVSALPGDRIPVLTKHVRQQTIDAWAKVSGDYNPLHTDPEFAAASRFGGTIAHGHLPLAWFCELLIAWAGTAWLSAGELLDVRFIAPVRPGAVYEVAGLVTGVQDDRAIIELEIAGPEGTCVRGGATAPLPGSPDGKGDTP